MTTERSLQVSKTGIAKARAALKHQALTKKGLAEELEFNFEIVNKFFQGEPIDRNYFYLICERLNLEWAEIVVRSSEEPEEAVEEQDISSDDIDALVQELRSFSRSSIQQQCGTMQVLDLTQPIGVNDIYTNVNILQKITRRQRLAITDLPKASVSNQLERPSFTKIAQDQVPGLEAVKKYSKLIVLGKPGAGKTTFLKYVAVQCSLGEVQANRVPIFIRLREFAATQPCTSLLKYIAEKLFPNAVTDTVIAERLLSQGRGLVLLDGLDEVKATEQERVLQEVRNFSTQFHANHFVISCRIAAQEYAFEQFTEVEIADFNEQQIASFATKWFAAKDPIKSEKFIRKLKENSPIQELAICPLLLTMLCLVFEELAEFPTNRAELYQEGLNILLKKWDAKRNIERAQVYKQLSVQHKEDLLSSIALATFQQGKYFFKQKEVEQYISDYIRNLSDVGTDPEALQMDSKAVLKSIEAQHGLLVERAVGIYSFSHLTFHEYFASREIIASSQPQALEAALKQLVSRIIEPRWHEVFLLTISMLRNADYLLLLMKQQIDNLVAPDPHLQEFLTWLSYKSQTVTASDQPSVVRAFYFDIDHVLDLTLLGGNCALDFALAVADGTSDFNLTFVSGKLALALNLALDHALTLDLARNLALEEAASERASESELKRSLQQLQDQLPKPHQDGERFQVWWQAKGQTWTETLRTVMLSLRNLDRNWQFSNRQRETLRQYYDANQLLMDCLHSDCYATRDLREEIEKTSLLPIAEIEQRRSELSR